MPSQAHWLRPPKAATGRDHLGTQAIPIALYDQLLPGITNVTDRARYFSFYPWLFERMAERGLEDELPALRRAECLFALIAERHALKRGEPADQHGLAMVGRDTLVPLLKNGAREASFANLARQDAETEERVYFKNKGGGFRQYYLGPLRELELVGDPHEQGTVLAVAMDEGVDAEQFFQVLSAGVVTTEELDTLATFCPCALPHSEQECEALIDVFFDRKDHYGDLGLQRRWSLALLLDAVGNGAGAWGDISSNFRGACYAGSLDSATEWEPAEDLRDTRRMWAVYEANELLSVALQGVLWASLEYLREHQGVADSSPWLANRMGDLAASFLGSDAALTFSEAQRQAAEELPPLRAWTSEGHEIQRARAVPEAQGVSDALRASLDVLIAVGARSALPDSPYRAFSVAEHQHQAYACNLRSYVDLCSGAWANLRLPEFVRWIALRWVLEQHLRVSLRKLHHESLDTLRFQPTDDGIHLVANISPAFTSPRLRTAIRMLRDLGLLNRPEAGGVELTPRGREVLGWCT